MITRWNTLCGRKAVETETDTVDIFGGAVCCWTCFSIYQARQSWSEFYEGISA
jgi:hypothetical protein